MNYSIGIDTRMLYNTGIGTYLRGLLQGFESSKFPKENIRLFGKQPSGKHSFMTGEFHSKIYSISEQAEYPFRLKNCTLWHAPHYNVPVLKGTTKLVVTIHDLIHWIFRKQFFTPLQALYAGTLLKQAVQKADQIITVSSKTKSDLMEHFDADPAKISVIYEGVSEHFKPEKDPEKIQAVRKKYSLPEKFFLYVGLLKPHKNVHWLIRTFRRLKQERKLEGALVLVGKKDSRYPVGFEELTNLETDADVVHLPYVDHGDLLMLYNSALSLVHPSLYEGFGLTLLEAMACETPVVACNAASIPEVVGDAGVLFEPNDDKALGEALIRMETDSDWREALAQKGRARAAQFKWEEMAEKTFEVYRKLL